MPKAKRKSSWSSITPENGDTVKRPRTNGDDGANDEEDSVAETREWWVGKRMRDIGVQTPDCGEREVSAFSLCKGRWLMPLRFPLQKYIRE